MNVGVLESIITERVFSFVVTSFCFEMSVSH